jgi:hypothetical protein
MLRRASEGQELVYIRASVESPTVRVT